MSSYDDAMDEYHSYILEATGSGPKAKRPREDDYEDAPGAKRAPMAVLDDLVPLCALLRFSPANELRNIAEEGPNNVLTVPDPRSGRLIIFCENKLSKPHPFSLLPASGPPVEVTVTTASGSGKRATLVDGARFINVTGMSGFVDGCIPTDADLRAALLAPDTPVHLEISGVPRDTRNHIYLAVVRRGNTTYVSHPLEFHRSTPRLRKTLQARSEQPGTVATTWEAYNSGTSTLDLECSDLFESESISSLLWGDQLVTAPVPHRLLPFKTVAVTEDAPTTPPQMTVSLTSEGSYMVHVHQAEMWHVYGKGEHPTLPPAPTETYYSAGVSVQERWGQPDKLWLTPLPGEESDFCFCVAVLINQCLWAAYRIFVQNGVIRAAADCFEEDDSAADDYSFCARMIDAFSICQNHETDVQHHHSGPEPLVSLVRPLSPQPPQRSQNATLQHVVEASSHSIFTEGFLCEAYAGSRLFSSSPDVFDAGTEDSLRLFFEVESEVTEVPNDPAHRRRLCGKARDDVRVGPTIERIPPRKKPVARRQDSGSHPLARDAAVGRNDGRFCREERRNRLSAAREKKLRAEKLIKDGLIPPAIDLFAEALDLLRDWPEYEDQRRALIDDALRTLERDGERSAPYLDEARRRLI